MYSVAKDEKKEQKGGTGDDGTHGFARRRKTGEERGET